MLDSQLRSSSRASLPGQEAHAVARAGALVPWMAAKRPETSTGGASAGISLRSTASSTAWTAPGRGIYLLLDVFGPVLATNISTNL